MSNLTSFGSGRITGTADRKPVLQTEGGVVGRGGDVDLALRSPSVRFSGETDGLSAGNGWEDIAT